MKDYKTQDIRNVVLLGATKSGKTTLAEAMLFEGKVIDRRGTVEDKNTVSDNTEIEKMNQRSIYASPLYAEFMDKKINILDAPGSDDFIGGAYAGLTVCESGVLVINAQQGVEVGTENILRIAEARKLPLIIAANQLDAEKADWDNFQASLKESLGGKFINIQFPVNAGISFNGFVDVLTMKFYRFKDDKGTREDLEIPAEYADQAELYRNELIEKVAEYDDALMEKFFAEGTLTEDEIRKGLGIGAEPQPEAAWHCNLEMRVARHQHVFVFFRQADVCAEQRFHRLDDRLELGSCKQPHGCHHLVVARASGVDFLSRVAELGGKLKLYLRVHVFHVVLNHKLAVLGLLVQVLELGLQGVIIGLGQQPHLGKHIGVGHAAKNVVFSEIKIHLTVLAHGESGNKLAGVKSFVPKFHIVLLYFQSVQK